MKQCNGSKGFFSWHIIGITFCGGFFQGVIERGPFCQGSNIVILRGVLLYRCIAWAGNFSHNHGSVEDGWTFERYLLFVIPMFH